MMVKKSVRKFALAIASVLVAMGVMIVLFLAVTRDVQAAESEFRWQHYGADPFAKTRIEAMAKREHVFRKSFGFSNACVEVAMKVTSMPGKVEHLNKGDRLAVMVSRNFVAHRNTVVDFPPVRKGIEYAATTETWEFECDGRRYKVALPEVCYNLALYQPVPLPPPAPVSPQAKCYIIPFDYRNTPGIVWNEQHRAHVSAHLTATEKELETVNNDPCFAVVDAKGSRKPFHRCEFCVEGEYPPAELARAVGLPAEKPKSVLSFYLQDGVGHVSLPLSWAARWMLFCVDVIAYPITVVGYEGWQAVSRFDVVEKNEIERTLPKGRLDRTLAGARHY